MNLKDRIEIELARNYTPILNDALACIVELNYDHLALLALYDTLEGFDLPLDSEALSEALAKSKADYMALADRYDKLSDIADSYADISHKLIYGSAE
jgi:hypothetical protein